MFTVLIFFRQICCCFLVLKEECVLYVISAIIVQCQYQSLMIKLSYVILIRLNSFYFWLHTLHSFQKPPPEVLYKKGVLSNFAKFTGKHLCQGLFFNENAVWSKLTSSVIIANHFHLQLRCLWYSPILAQYPLKKSENQRFSRVTLNLRL